MTKIVIPEALQIVVDDLGWFCGKDDRAKGGSSRTGMPRNHCHLDYVCMNELGKALGQKIFCAFVIGEWDPDNRLACFDKLSKYGSDWNNAAYLDRDEMEKVAETVRSAEYIDLALHGLNHGYYMDGVDNTDLSDYYYNINKVRYMVDEKEIRARLDKFFEILDYYKIGKKVTGMVPPSGAYRMNELSYILRDYGIKYVSTPFKFMRCENCEKPEYVGFEESGMILIDRTTDSAKWDECDVDYDSLSEKYADYGSHWPNFLHPDPQRNLEVVDRAARYFKKCAQNIGCIISRDMRFAVTQSFYKKYAKVALQNDTFVIDISEVPVHEDMNGVFYVNSTQPITEYSGCTVKEYDRKDDFITYEITPSSSVIRIR